MPERTRPRYKALLHVINVLLVRLPQLKDLLFMFRYA